MGGSQILAPGLPSEGEIRRDPSYLRGSRGQGEKSKKRKNNP